jgi:hypothetical protein
MKQRPELLFGALPWGYLQQMPPGWQHGAPGTQHLASAAEAETAPAKLAANTPSRANLVMRCFIVFNPPFSRSAHLIHRLGGARQENERPKI